MKHEIFRLLKMAYPNAGESTRLHLLDWIDQKYKKESEEDIKAERIRQYEYYNLILWLYRIAPNCPLVANKFEALQQKHSDFAPREHPDLDPLYAWPRMGRSK